MEPSLFELWETSLDPATTKHYEGAFAQGSGYLHIRGSYEEGLLAAGQDEEYMRLPANVTIEKPRHPRSKWGTYVPGVTGNHPLLREELVNLPNPLVFRVAADGEALDMDACRIKGYSRSLCLRNGVLTREFLWDTASGAVIACRYERFVSQKRRSLIVQRMTYSVVSGKSILHFTSDIDEKVKTNGYNHFAETEKDSAGCRTQVRVKTDNNDTIWLASTALGKGIRFQETENHTLESETSLQEGESIFVLKLSAVCTSRDQEGGAGFDKLAAELALPEDSWKMLFQENQNEWESLWEQAEIQIEGDEEAQRAVNFSIYHLLRSASQTDDRIAVCAKGFAGEAYFGHFFWDTELYLLPFFLYNFPATAKNLTAFRLRTLEGAKQNARAYGYSGARYPWESSVSGSEQCPNWQYADNEVHVTADVIFGIWHYYEATGDKTFLFDAAPVFTETARYWLDRVEYRDDGSIHLNGVMGPDEYICFCNDSAYTNSMVKFALERTLEVLGMLEQERPEAYRALGVSQDFLDQVALVSEKLPVLTRDDGTILQCEGFEQFEEPHFERFWPDRSKHFGACVSQERNYRVKALKQADVLMLPYLFPAKFSEEDIRKAMAYYLPYTTHDSSLSAIIHSILFARLGDRVQAMEFFRRGLDIDLDSSAGGAAEGIHIANCGGIWQAVVFGFAGMLPAYESKTPSFSPNLPDGWKSLSFRIVCQGRKYRITIRGTQAETEEIQ